MNPQQAIGELIEGRDLDEAAAAALFAQIMDGEATPAQIGAVLALLRRKGETIAEITGAARAMRERSTKIAAGEGRVLDTCGTGGDGAGTFNISTATALTAAAAGCRVAKHGNRAMSGKVGGADVLEALGVKIDVEISVVEASLAAHRFGFLFAQKLHAAMKHAAGPRRELGTRTIFNLLGPLTNPAGARHQLMGVFSAQWVRPIAEVLGRLGSTHALVVHGEDGLDEMSISAPTRIAEWRDGAVIERRVEASDFGIERADAASLKIENAEESAAMIRSALRGDAGPARNVVQLNAGAAIYAADLADSLEAGVARAGEVLASGAALKLLEAVGRTTRGEA